MPKEAYKPAFLVPTVKYEDGSVTIWAAISWYSSGPIITLIGRITTRDYVDILGKPVHPMVQMLLCNNAIFQEDNLRTRTLSLFLTHTHTHTHTESEVFSLSLRSINMHLNSLLGQHNRQT